VSIARLPLVFASVGAAASLAVSMLVCGIGNFGFVGEMLLKLPWGTYAVSPRVVCGIAVAVFASTGAVFGMIMAAVVTRFKGR